MKKLAFVIPWYSDTMGGGAETACRLLAKNLQHHGARVEVLTTCVKDFRSDWSSNHFAEGTAMEGGVPVRRFAVSGRDRARFDAVNSRLMRGMPISAQDEQIFLREMLNCNGLYRFIEEHREEYVFLFLPYLFSTTYWGSRAAGMNGALIPCLHDEEYARLPAFRQMFASTGGVLFLSRAERDLAKRLYPAFSEIGVPGLPLDCSWSGDAARFTEKFGLTNFLLYAGRTDTGKNADLLMDYFGEYVGSGREELRLVFIGSGEVRVPPELAGNLHVLGFLSEQDKRDCLAASLALCVPSVMESFSIVMMESWIAGRPVIVNAQCAVTSGFCRDSNGGLWFENYAEFREIVDYLRENPEAAAAMGRSGAAFVREQFDSATVARNYLNALQPFLGAGNEI